MYDQVVLRKSFEPSLDPLHKSYKYTIRWLLYLKPFCIAVLLWPRKHSYIYSASLLARHNKAGQSRFLVSHHCLHQLKPCHPKCPFNVPRPLIRTWSWNALFLSRKNMYEQLQAGDHFSIINGRQPASRKWLMGNKEFTLSGLN